jgi:hypothetical protein
MDFPDDIWKIIKSYSFDYKTYWKNKLNKSLLYFNEGRERYHLTDHQHNILSKIDNYKIVPTAVAIQRCDRYGDWMLYGENHITFFYGWKKIELNKNML